MAWSVVVGGRLTVVSLCCGHGGGGGDGAVAGWQLPRASLLCGHDLTDYERAF